MLSGADDNQYSRSTANVLDERELEAMLSSKTAMQQNCSKIHVVLLTFGLPILSDRSGLFEVLFSADGPRRLRIKMPLILSRPDSLQSCIRDL